MCFICFFPCPLIRGLDPVVTGFSPLPSTLVTSYPGTENAVFEWGGMSEYNRIFKKWTLNSELCFEELVEQTLEGKGAADLVNPSYLSLQA